MTDFSEFNKGTPEEKAEFLATIVSQQLDNEVLKMISACMYMMSPGEAKGIINLAYFTGQSLGCAFGIPDEAKKPFADLLQGIMNAGMKRGIELRKEAVDAMAADAAAEKAATDAKEH